MAVEGEREPNPFTCAKVLNKFEQQAFNYAVKLAVEDSEPTMSKTDAFKQVSNQWNDQTYRKVKTAAYLTERVYKVSGQLEQLDNCLEALSLNL